LGLQNLDIGDMHLVITDQGDLSSPSTLDMSSTCQCAIFTGSVDCSGASNFVAWFATNCEQVTITSFVGPESPTVSLFVTRTAWEGTNISCLFLEVAESDSFVDTGTLSVGADGAECLLAIMTLGGLTVSGGGAEFISCQLTCPTMNIVGGATFQ